MYIDWLQIRHVRNLSEVRLEPVAKLNVLVGPNGSGKTAVLEAIHFLSRCRSFRTPRVTQVIQGQKTALQISAGLYLPGEISVTAGIERGPGKMQIRYNGEDVRRVSEQAGHVPVVCVTPDSHQFITGGARYRRRWLDWAMFHVEPGYIECWRHYHKALKSRNNLLKQRQADQLSYWEKEMDVAATGINQARQVFIDDLNVSLALICKALTIPLPVLRYKPGWELKNGLAQCLKESRERDLENGNTRYGIHRSDLEIKDQDKEIGQLYSRGQLKCFLLALSLAQMQVFHSHKARYPILLVDDLPAELDGESQSRIIEMLMGHSGQVFISTTREAMIDRFQQEKMFHMEHGNVTI